MICESTKSPLHRSRLPSWQRESDSVTAYKSLRVVKKNEKGYSIDEYPLFCKNLYVLGLG